jgi:hypothetical protein
MVVRAQQNNLVTGVLSNLFLGGVAILQYADDTTVCLEHNLEKSRNVKLLLYMFEQMSGLKTNFDKGEVLLVGGDDEIALSYAEILNCSTNHFPLTYLGVPISTGRLHVIDWVRLEEKAAKKLEVWKGGPMFYGGRTILVNSSLSSSSIYHMSMFLLPKITIKNLDKIMFFWQGGSVKKKYHLVKWTKFYKDRKKGGLGVKNLRKLNISLMCKWWWLLEHEGLWQGIVKLKYVKNTLVCLIKSKVSSSPEWSDLLKIRHTYMKGREYNVKNGNLTSFLLDPWMGDEAICKMYPILYDLCLDQMSYVHDVVAAGWVVHFSWVGCSLQDNFASYPENAVV